MAQQEDDRDWVAKEVVPDPKDYVGRKRYFENNAVLPWTDKEEAQKRYMDISGRALLQKEQERYRDWGRSAARGEIPIAVTGVVKSERRRARRGNGRR